jgi:hypothetical protein
MVLERRPSGKRKGEKKRVRQRKEKGKNKSHSLSYTHYSSSLKRIVLDSPQKSVYNSIACLILQMSRIYIVASVEISLGGEEKWRGCHKKKRVLQELGTGRDSGGDNDFACMMDFIFRVFRNCSGHDGVLDG